MPETSERSGTVDCNNPLSESSLHSSSRENSLGMYAAPRLNHPARHRVQHYNTFHAERGGCDGKGPLFVLYPGASIERGRHLLPQSHNVRLD